MLKSDDILQRAEEATKNPDKQIEINRQAIRIHEYIKNNQWIDVSKTGHVKQMAYDEEYYNEHRAYRPRPVHNLMFPAYRTYLAYLIQTRGKIQAVPESVEDVLDVLGARVAQRYMEYVYKVVFVRNLSLEIYNYVLKCGTAILHQFWNKYTDEVDGVVIPPSEFYPWPRSARKWRNVKGFFWKRRVPTIPLQSQYPNKEISADGGNENDYLVSLSDKSAIEEPKTTLIDVYMLPLGKDKTGTFARYCNQGVMLEGPQKLPYIIKNRQGQQVLNFSLYFDNWLGDELWGFPTLAAGLSIQDDHNEGLSNKIRMRNIYPKLTVDVDALKDPEAAVDDDTTIIEYRSTRVSGEFWKYTSPPQVSPALWDTDKDPAAFEHSTLLHEITMRGATPSAIQSGEGVKALRAGDELRMLPAVEFTRLGLIDSFDKWYQIGRPYYKTKKAKLKRILGEMGELDIITFDDIKLSPMTFTIEEASFSPFSQQVRQQKAMTVLQAGLVQLGDPRERRKIIRYLDNQLADELDVTSPQEKLAKIENIRMLKGETVAINPDDNDPVHLENHLLIRHDFRINRKPEARKRLDEHINKHKAQMNDKVEQAIKLQQAMAPQANKQAMPSALPGSST